MKDLLHLKGQYKDGERDGDWGQWYFNGHKEMTSTYTKGKAGNIVYYSEDGEVIPHSCLLYTSPSPRDATLSRMPSSA